MKLIRIPYFNWAAGNKVMNDKLYNPIDIQFIYEIDRVNFPDDEVVEGAKSALVSSKGLMFSPLTIEELEAIINEGLA